LTMCTYNADPGSASEDGLKLLESWYTTRVEAGDISLSALCCPVRRPWLGGAL